jgi:hypothetical protein
VQCVRDLYCGNREVSPKQIVQWLKFAISVIASAESCLYTYIPRKGASLARVFFSDWKPGCLLHYISNIT